jgi:hypothetical protein
VSTLVTAVYADPETARRAVEALIEAHINPREISVVMADRSGRHAIPIEHDTGVAEGLTIGGTLGAALGATAGALLATGILAAPGIRVLAAGPLLAALRSAIAGMSAGGLVGALGGLGFWKDEADLHAEAVREGAVLLAVRADGERTQQLRELFRESGATRVTEGAAA